MQKYLHVVYDLDAVDMPTPLFSCNVDPKWHFIVICFDGKCLNISARIVDV
jgi:hypothetical protein